MRIASVSGMIGRLAACVEVASILLVSSAALAAPQLVLVNAKVFTADPALPYAQAVAIEDGRILAVGGNDQVRALAGPNTRIIDAGGRLVTPGLNRSPCSSRSCVADAAYSHAEPAISWSER